MKKIKPVLRIIFACFLNLPLPGLGLLFYGKNLEALIFILTFSLARVLPSIIRPENFTSNLSVVGIWLIIILVSYIRLFLVIFKAKPDPLLRTYLNNWFICLLIGTACGSILKQFKIPSIRTFKIANIANLPNLYPGDVILSTNPLNLRRGTNIVFKSKEDYGDVFIVGRIIGLPGEKITLAEGKMYINSRSPELSNLETSPELDKILQQDLHSQHSKVFKFAFDNTDFSVIISDDKSFCTTMYEEKSVTLTNTQYLVSGDNWCNSQVMAKFKPIEVEQIEYKVLGIVYTRMRSLFLKRWLVDFK